MEELVAQLREEQKFFSVQMGEKQRNGYRYRRKIQSVCHLLTPNDCNFCSSNGGECENETELTELKRNIGFALFGGPNALLESQNCFTGYTEDQNKHISKIFQEIMYSAPADHVSVSIVFVHHFISYQEELQRIPVFRIPMSDIRFKNPKSQYCFVDDCGRCYNGWDDYVCSNKLPKGAIFYPKDGIYSHDENIRLQYRLTPCAKLKSRIGRGLDYTAIVGSVAGTAACLFFPPAAVIGGGVLASSGLYSLGRNVVSLVDRKKHRQSIKLTDKDALGLWIDSAASVFNCVAGCSSALSSALLKSGKVSSGVKASKIFRGSTCGVITCNGANFRYRVRCFQNNKEDLLMECLKFTSFLLFFCVSVEDISVRCVEKFIVSWLRDKLGEICVKFYNWLCRLCSNASKEGVHLVLDNVVESFGGNDNEREMLSIFFLKGPNCKSLMDYVRVAGEFVQCALKLDPKRYMHWFNNFQRFNDKDHESVKVDVSSTQKSLQYLQETLSTLPTLEELTEEEMYAIPKHLLTSGKFEMTEEQCIIIGQNMLALPKVDPMVKIFMETSAFLSFGPLGKVVIRFDFDNRLLFVRTVWEDV